MDPASHACVKWDYGTIGRIPQDMVMKLTILRDLYYLDSDETIRTLQLDRPSKDDSYQDKEGEEDGNRE